MRRLDLSKKDAGQAQKNGRQRAGSSHVAAKKAPLGGQVTGTEAIISFDAFVPPYQGPFAGAWGNRADLPQHSLPEFLRKEAEALREIGILDLRLTRLALLIGQARLSGWLGLEDQIIESAGLTPTQFWWLYVPRQYAPENFAFALARMMADPTDRDISGTVLPIVPGTHEPRHDSMAPILWQLYRVLRRAYQTDEPFFVRVRPASQAVPIRNRARLRPRPAVEIITDDAGRYIAADPRTRELLHPSYVAFLEAGGHTQPYPKRPVIGQQNASTGSDADVSEASKSGSATTAPGRAEADASSGRPAMAPGQLPNTDGADGDEPTKDNPIAAMRRTRDALMGDHKIVQPMERAEQHRLILRKLELDPKKPPRGYGYETFRSKVAVDS